jgi:hypothetical protein
MVQAEAMNTRQRANMAHGVVNTTTQHRSSTANLDGSAHILASWPAVLRYSPPNPSLPTGQLFQELPQSHMTPCLGQE